MQQLAFAKRQLCRYKDGSKGLRRAWTFKLTSVKV